MNARSASDDSARGQDTVFFRTALGNSAARAPDADLPRMVKTLLIAVDGRTSVRMFQKLLPNFGDVSALLDKRFGRKLDKRAADRRLCITITPTTCRTALIYFWTYRINAHLPSMND